MTRTINFDLGVVQKVGDGIAIVSGLENVRSGELITFPRSGLQGLALNLMVDHVGVVILGNERYLSQSDLAERTGTVVKIPTTFKLFGRIIDALGKASDGGEEIEAKRLRAIDVKAPGVLARKPIRESLETGILAIDSMFPIGRGQRELIIGDKNTGKTTIALDTIVHQRSVMDLSKQVFCIYVSIGQKKSSVLHIASRLRKEGALAYTAIVSASSSDAAALQFLAPYTGCTIGDFVRDQGYSALIIYDDLTKHAIAYRQMSLLLRRPPGREAFPGDIFYVHSRLLERACKLNDVYGNGSLTAFPIVETQDGDVSTYIPTNVISITDGQIFLDTQLFKDDYKPAVNVGLSVSRVGAAAQALAMREVSRSLKLDLAQYRELQSYSALTSDLDDATKATLAHGLRLTEILRQEKFSPMAIQTQIMLLSFVQDGFAGKFSITQTQLVKECIVGLGKEGEFSDYLDIHKSLETSAKYIAVTLNYVSARMANLFDEYRIF